MAQQVKNLAFSPCHLIPGLELLYAVGTAKKRKGGMQEMDSSSYILGLGMTGEEMFTFHSRCLNVYHVQMFFIIIEKTF